jgi:type I restriction enzyme S subunit
VNPKLRFPAFSGDWEISRLGDFFTFKNGVNADKSMYGSGRKFINVMDVIADAPITHDAIIGTVEITDKEFEKNEVIHGDVLFQRSSETREEVGQSNIYIDERPATFGGFVIRGRPKQKIDSHFFDALLKTAPVRKDMTSRSGGSTRYNIGQESLDAVSVWVAPTLDEQQEIAGFLGVVDARIRLLQRQHTALEQYKKCLVGRLFAQTLRFKRDDGTAFPDWRRRSIGSIFEWIGTNSLSREMLTDEPGAIQNIHYGDIHGKFPARFKQSEQTAPFVRPGALSQPIRPEQFCLAGDVVIADASEDYADVGKSIEIIEAQPQSLIAGLHTYLARPKAGEIALGFSAYLFQTWALRKQIMRIAQGISVLGVSKPNLSNLLVELPHPDEQRKIVALLSTIDDKIVAVAAKTSAMQSFKKGLLQQMFV